MEKKNTIIIAIITLAAIALVVLGISIKAKTISITPLSEISILWAGSHEGIISKYCSGFTKCIDPINN